MFLRGLHTGESTSGDSEVEDRIRRFPRRRDGTLPPYHEKLIKRYRKAVAEGRPEEAADLGYEIVNEYAEQVQVRDEEDRHGLDGVRGTSARLAGYYDASGLTIAEVVRRYVERGDKAYDSGRKGPAVGGGYFIPTEELYAIREYDRDAKHLRPGPVPVGVKPNGCPEDYDYGVPASDRWERMKTWMREYGWKCDPAHVEIDHEGRVKLGEGNHRVHLARELGLAEVPVMFHFRGSPLRANEYGYLWQLRNGRIVNVAKPSKSIPSLDGARKSTVWHNRWLEQNAQYPGQFYPSLALNKLIAAGGVLPITALTKFERRRIASFEVGAKYSRNKTPLTREAWLTIDGRQQKAVEITAFGWQKLNEWAAEVEGKS